ncbi:MAG: flagellar biosynthesis protein FlhF [Oscillospiraceae bacterium]|nr:flagellar biosynthesis protein FlhF [Oscillospiraceae bacterium]
MLVKRYHAKDMQQAMDTVIKELGSDAVILNSRRVRKKGIKNLFRKPVLEVMVAYDPANVPAVKKMGIQQGASGYDKPAKEPKSKAAALSSEQLERLDKRIDSIDEMLSDFIEKFSFVKRDITYDYPDEVQDLLVSMIENQVREELAHSLAKQTDQMLRRQQGTDAAEVMEHLVLEQFGRPEPILHKKFTQKIILVLGPTGVGKTTTIVKLAADFAVKQKKKVGIINTDTFRIGAQEQLQTYADILGIPLQVVYWADELEKAVENMSDRDIIFVDTAGKRPGDEKHKEDLLDIVRILRPEDTLLCLSATAGFASIKEVVDTYGFMEDYRILITKIDETKFRGPLLNISWYAQKPLAYVTVGQNVPDDIEVADIETIAKQIVRGHASADREQEPEEGAETVAIATDYLEYIETAKSAETAEIGTDTGLEPDRLERDAREAEVIVGQLFEAWADDGANQQS